MKSQQFIVFSDLDGTLLDHYSYQWTAAHSTLMALKHEGIPVILNTSKTRAELQLIQSQLSLDTPFIIENGAAILIPITTFECQPVGTKQLGNFWLKELSSYKQQLLSTLANTAQHYQHLYRGFSSLSTAKLAQITGLNLQQAQLAKQRQYGEPILWQGDKASKDTFVALLQSQGVQIQQGGRFIHLSDHCDKGKALNWLTEQYRNHYPEHQITTIALGDGHNDIPMLEAADLAVIVRSPVHDYPKLQRVDGIIRTVRCGPEGWADAIQQLVFTPPTTAPMSIHAKEVNHG